MVVVTRSSKIGGAAPSSNRITIGKSKLSRVLYSLLGAGGIVGASLLTILQQPQSWLLGQSRQVASVEQQEQTPHELVPFGSRRQLLPTLIPSNVGEPSTTRESSQQQKGDEEAVTSSSSSSSLSSSLWANDYNVVHVVNTRFMQHQADLIHLGQARLDLMATFTVPSLLRQSNQQYLWIIWTDVKLQDPVKTALLDLVGFLPHVLVLGAEQGPETNLRNWYGHSWMTLTSTPVLLSGQVQLLEDYYQAAQTHLLLETSLDADDAFSQTYIETVQAEAVFAMGNGDNNTKTTKTNKMEVFCPEVHAEWRYYQPNKDLSTSKTLDLIAASPEEMSYKNHNKNDLSKKTTTQGDRTSSSKHAGYLVQVQNHKFCIKSGLTAVYHVDAQPRRLLPCIEAQEHPDCDRRGRSLGANGICNANGSFQNSNETVDTNDDVKDHDKNDNENDGNENRSRDLRFRRWRRSPPSRTTDKTQNRHQHLIRNRRRHAKLPARRPVVRKVFRDFNSRQCGLQTIPQGLRKQLRRQSNSCPRCDSAMNYAHSHDYGYCPKGSFYCRGQNQNGDFVDRALFTKQDLQNQNITAGTTLRFQCRPVDCAQDVLFFDVTVRLRHDTYVYAFDVKYYGAKKFEDRQQCSAGSWLTDRDYTATLAYVQSFAEKAMWKARIPRHAYYKFVPKDQNQRWRPDWIGGGLDGRTAERFFAYGLLGFGLCVAPTPPLAKENRNCVRKLRLLPEWEQDPKVTSYNDNDDENGNDDESVASDIQYKTMEASVLLARTPTAAGMKHVIPKKGDGVTTLSQDKHNTELLSTAYGSVGSVAQDKAWRNVQENFGVSRSQVVALRHKLQGNLESILIDAFQGQCTPGHSCKDSTKEALGHLWTKFHHDQVSMDVEGYHHHSN